MWDWIVSQFDTLDIIVITAVLVGGVYFLLLKGDRKSTRSSVVRSSAVSPNVTAARQQKEQGFLGRMKNEGRKVLILYGSQTGTAEELSGRLAKDLTRYSQKALVIDPEEMEVDDLTRLPEVNDCLLVLCVATYGEGDPTDNAQQLYEFINNTDTDLKGVKYAIFGLGNKTYENFNKVAKDFDQRLEELGAERVYQMGLGDDDANLEEDFMRWREGFLPHVAGEFGWELNTDAESQRQYRLEMIDEGSTVTLFKGEYGRLGAFERQRPPFDLKNPFMATVGVNRELHTDKSDRNCRHIELLVEGSRIRYEAGDHVAIFPTNDSVLVQKILDRLDVSPEQAFRLINTDEESSKRNPFPCPTTVKTALTHYVDIASPVKSHVLKAISEFCENEDHKKYLLLLSAASEEGMKEYAQFILKERRSIVDIFDAFSSCRPPFDYLMELLPRLQARYYSIASSPKHFESSIHVTAVVTKYSIGDRLIKGVCTNYLLDKKEGEKVPIFVRKSQMRLPHRTTTPVIMIGPGTGLAPFRGFVQERAFHKRQGKEVGDLVLFFGCRQPDVDFIYQNELEQFEAEGVISQLNVAFSRLTTEKCYVQHKVWENRDKVWELVNAGAHIYVCGDARNMAKDVQKCLLRIFVEIGGKNVDDASKFLKDLERQRRYQADVWS